MRDQVLTDMERLGAFEDAERTFQMNEDAFRLFYDQTARPVWLYLSRMTGDSRLADDLLQETYYRFLRSRTTFAGDDHRRNYLFRIATNLVRDHRRRPHPEVAQQADGEVADRRHVDAGAADRAARHIDLERAMEQLKPRDRAMLWLAYAQGFSHEEIAASIGVRTSSLKALLYRARRRLVGLLAQPSSRGGRR